MCSDTLVSALTTDWQLVKLDVDTGEVQRWEDEDYAAGEPVFIQAPAAHQEDEGEGSCSLVLVSQPGGMDF